MKTYEILRTKNGFKFREAHSGSQFRHFDNTVSDYASILRYFQEGRHTDRRGQYDTPQICFCDHNGRPVKHYAITRTDNGWLKGTMDFGATHRFFYPDDVWSEADRLEYLRDENRVPTDFETLPEVLQYLNARQPEAVQDYERKLTEKLKEGIPKLCAEHASKYYNATAITEFQDTTGSEQ